MKVRITDLLDSYYDDTVKLDPPKELDDASTSPSALKKRHTGRLYRPLLAAASLILVISGAAALSLGFLRASTGGHAMQPGTAAPEESVTISDSSEDAAPEIPLDELSRLSYTQKGSLFITEVTLSPISSDYISQDVPAYDPSTEESGPALTVYDPDSPDTALDDINVYQTGYDSQTETLFLTVSSVLSESTDRLEFSVQLPAVNADAEPFAAGVIVAIPFPELDGYTEYDSGGLYTFTEDIHGFSGTLIHTEVTSDQVSLTVEAPMLEDALRSGDSEAVSTALQEYDNTLLEALPNWPLQIVMDDGNIISYPITQLHEVCLSSDTSADSQLLEDVDSAFVEIRFPLEEGFLDPRYIGIVNFPDPSVTGNNGIRTDVNIEVDETIQPDGTLTAVLDLPCTLDGETGYLQRFALELSTGKYFWYLDVPSLEQMLYEISPDGNISMALDENVYQELLIRWSNAFLDNYQVDAHLMFTDGTSIRLGSGDVILHEDGCIINAGSLSWDADDSGIDVEGLTPDLLIINDESYYFELS